MHASSLENMQRCYRRYVENAASFAQGEVLVVDVGGADVNGSYREIFADPRFKYITVDLAAGKGVDVVLDDPYELPFDDESLDIVVSGQMLEHCEFFWRTFDELVRVLKPGGLLIMIAPSAGPIHRYPVDCYRFYPDAYRALAKNSGCQVLDIRLDERGPWRDLVGVFLKPHHKNALSPAMAVATPAKEDRKLFDLAERLLTEGQLVQAASILIELAQADTPLWEVYWKLSEVALAQKDEIAAIELLRAAIAKVDGPTSAHIELARIEVRQGNGADALETLSPWLKEQPETPAIKELVQQALCTSQEVSPQGWSKMLACLRESPRERIRQGTNPALQAAMGRKAISNASSPPRTKFDPLRSPPGTPEEEATRGDRPYLDVLDELHQCLEPDFYLEIGVRNGDSLRLAKCAAIGIDPAPSVNAASLSNTTKLYRMTSDEFFELPESRSAKPDLAFIDGMHLFEFALRDFMNIERQAQRNTIVVIDDIFPTNAAQAERDRRTRVWTGDVWKFYQCIAERRPDLFILALDTAPTGLLLVSGLDPTDKVLWSEYNAIVRHYRDLPGPPAAILNRAAAIPASSAVLKMVAQLAKKQGQINPSDTAREQRQLALARTGPNQMSAPARITTTDDLARELHQTKDGNHPRKLTAIVICYNMTREIPRTVLSLSARLQRDIREEDYEIIVIDNGSTDGFDVGSLTGLGSNIVTHRVAPAKSSPVEAINLALSMARGALVGVFVDGARIASPRLLATALEAAQLHARAVIGAQAFHLGPDFQWQSSQNGYDQRTEDQLLESIQWTSNPYRLFEISVFAGSSQKGWFAMPAESTALFMQKAMWNSLGGFDEAFVTPGGGLSNLDVWYRACSEPASQPILLLGEATFHQIHGGVSTNSTDRWRQFHLEYEALRGKPYQAPTCHPLFIGKFPTEATRSLTVSTRLV